MTNKNNNENDVKTSEKTKASKKQRMAKFLKYTLYTFIVLALTGVSLVAFIMYSTYKEIGEVNLDAINKAISRPSVMYDSNGKVVDEFKSSDGRIMAKFEDVPQDLKDAIMAIEDTEFEFRVVTVSGGVAHYPTVNSENKTSFLNAADTALYKSKNTGKNKISLYR